MLAHATGFVCGALLGILVSRSRLSERLGRRGQSLLVAATLLVPVLAWVLGLVTTSG